MCALYPVIAQGYGVFIRPDGGVIFPYEECQSIKRGLSPCKKVNVQACAILQQCTGVNTLAAICDILKTTFEETPPNLFDSVKTFLDDLFKKKYIFYSETPTKCKGLIQGSLNYYVPSQILLETTTGCNLQCGHCYVSAGARLPDELSVSAFIPVLETLYTMGVNQITLSGGEILTKKDWNILADFCKKRFSFTINTNGILVADNVETLSQYKNVHISLYGKDAATHEKITKVKGSFNRTLTGITLLVKQGVVVCISLIVVPHNIHQVEDMVFQAASLNCKAVYIGVVSPVGRARKRQLELTKEQMNWLRTKIHTLKKSCSIDIHWEEDITLKDHWCGAGIDTWTITANGDVYPCEVWRMPIGNVIKDDIVDICTSPVVKRLQTMQTPHKALCGDCVWLSACEGCHAHAFALHSEVDHCRWVEQLV